MFKVAVDLGYGFVKALSENGKFVIFPSVVGGGMDRSLAAETLGIRQAKYHVVIYENGCRREYFVGDLALKELHVKSRAFEEDKIFHPATAILLLAAASLVGANGEVHLATGLPVNHYLSQRNRLRDFLLSLDQEVETVGWCRARVAVKRATLFPQAIGAFYSTVLDSQGRVGNASMLSGGLVGIVDVGYKTVDYAVIDTDAAELRSDLYGSMDLGISEAYHSLHKDVERQSGRMVDRFVLERRYCESQRFFLMGREYNLGTMMAPYLENLAKGIADHLQLAWRGSYAQISRVLVTGGGALDLRPYLEELHPMAELVNDPQMANVRGFLRIAIRSEESGRTSRLSP